MVLKLDGHHLTTVIQMKVIQEHVLTDEWQSARQMFPIFEEAVRTRTKVEPVRSHNFRVHLKKLVSEGKASCMEPEQISKKTGGKVSNPTKLYRKAKERNCSQCGECCRWFVLCDAKLLTAAGLSLLKGRGGKIEQGFALIPSECPNLELDVFDCSKFKCKIYDQRPVLCKDYIGIRSRGNNRFYVPDCCTMKVG